MFRAVSNAVTLSNSAGTQRRLSSRLFTSYKKGALQLHARNAPRTSAMPAGASVTGALRSTYFKEAPATPKAAAETGAFDESAEEVDVLEAKRSKAVATNSTAEAARPYVPLSDFSRIELQGDYLMEGGHPFDALKHYGAVAKAFTAAYPDNDNQRATITIKLSRAFRCCNMHDAAVQNAEHALFMLDNNSSPHLDLVCEALVELAEAKALRGDEDSGLVYEDVMSVIDAYHSLGNDVRTIRMMPRLGDRMGVGHAKKFFYITPFDTDRVFHLGDHAMERAEAFYRSVGNQEGVVRVLERRAQMINIKQFEMRDVSGRIRTLRGFTGIKGRNYGHSITPRELLAFSPTVHQVYIDRSTTNIAPVGREDEVMPGANRRVMDDGSYLRRERKRFGSGKARSTTNSQGVNSMNTIYDY